MKFLLCLATIFLARFALVSAQLLREEILPDPSLDPKCDYLWRRSQKKWYSQCMSQVEDNFSKAPIQGKFRDRAMRRAECYLAQGIMNCATILNCYSIAFYDTLSRLYLSKRLKMIRKELKDEDFNHYKYCDLRK